MVYDNEEPVALESLQSKVPEVSVVPDDARQKLIKVLLVEDNEFNRKIITSMLQKLRFEVPSPFSIFLISQ